MRWIVDAMNVVGSRPDGWWKDRRGALAGLVVRIEGWAAAGGHDVTVVLERPMPVTSTVITIAHAPRAAADSADDEIIRLLRIVDVPQDITVVTSDGALAARVRDAGAAVFPAGRFRELLD